VRRIEIATNRLVDQGVAGEYHSVFKGRGMEFAEVRPYQPGDDVRTIDWNVTARMGEPYVKRYVEERDLTVFLAVDVSGSLDFGSRAILKRELAAEVAALLAFAAVRNQDRVGAALVSDRLELFLPPRRRRTHVLRLVREVLTGHASGPTDLDASLADDAGDAQAALRPLRSLRLRRHPLRRCAQGGGGTARRDRARDRRPARRGAAGRRPGGPARRRDRAASRWSTGAARPTPRRSEARRSAPS
jgi:uncharacterized protein (DUF58 family)